MISSEGSQPSIGCRAYGEGAGDRATGRDQRLAALLVAWGLVRHAWLPDVAMNMHAVGTVGQRRL